MPSFDKKSKIIVTCSNRLAPFVEMEVRALGYIPDRVFKTGIEITGSLNDCIMLNVHLRCASQVLYSITTSKCVNADELYKHLLEFSWEEIINADSYFSITSNVTNSTISNNLFANVRVKDAIVDYFRKRSGSRLTVVQY